MQESGKKFDKESLDWLSPEFSRLFSSVLARTAGTTEAQNNPSLWDKAQLCKIPSARKRVKRDQLFSTNEKSWGHPLKPGDHRSVQKALSCIAKISVEREIPKCVVSLYPLLSCSPTLNPTAIGSSQDIFFLMGQTPFLVSKQGGVVGDIHTGDSVPVPEAIPVGTLARREPAACPWLFLAVLCLHKPCFSYCKKP